MSWTLVGQICVLVVVLTVCFITIYAVVTGKVKMEGDKTDG